MQGPNIWGETETWAVGSCGAQFGFLSHWIFIPPI